MNRAYKSTEKYREASKASYLRNREKRQAYGRLRWKTRPNAMRNSYLRRKFGISLAEKEEMYRDQQGLCKLCGGPLPEDFNKAHTDHDHTTGRIRGLLDSRCNKLIGWLETNHNLLSAAHAYIGWSD